MEYNYSFNADGLRIEKVGPEGTTVYMYEYDKVVMELDADGNMLAKNIYGTNLLTRTVDDGTLYYMYNGHADVTALIDTEGNVVGSYYYDVWGNIIESDGEMKDKNSILYAGYQYDSETDLYYLNARMYDPKIARFLQEDTYRGNVKDPLSLNLYTYCVNNPLIYWDPTGNVAANVRIGNFTYETGDFTNGITTVTEEEFFGKTGYGMLLEMDEDMIVIGENGERRIKIRKLSQKLGIEDTISYWTDVEGKMNVVIRPEMKNAPVKVKRTEDLISIIFSVDFSGNRINDIIPGSQVDYKPDSDGVMRKIEYPGGRTYKEAIIEGIKKWEVSNLLVDNMYVSTKVEIIDSESNNKNLNEKQSYLRINMNAPKYISYRLSDWNGRPYNIRYGEWSFKNPGSIYLFTKTRDSIFDNFVKLSFDSVADDAAHEIGHALGLGDAYDEKTRNLATPSEITKDGQKYNITDSDIMNSGTTISPFDIKLLLEALITGELQELPKK